MPSHPFTVALVGAGRVGTATAELLRRSGCEVVGVASRSAETRERAIALLNSIGVEPESLPRADVVLLGVTDAAIEKVASLIAPRLGPGQVVVHLAGALGLGPLDAVSQAGATPCALHPVQACPDVSSAIERLPGSAWGITCPEHGRRWAHDLVDGPLKGTPVDVPDEARPLWHAAAVTTSNGVAALMALGEALLRAMAVGSPERVLAPLAHGTVQNALEGGGGGRTLTGPVVRGETDTIARHVEAIAQRAPELLHDYELISELIRRAATAAGRITG